MQGKNSPADLYCLPAFIQFDLEVSLCDDGPEFRPVVAQIELPFPAHDLPMVPGHRNVIYPHLVVICSPVCDFASVFVSNDRHISLGFEIPVAFGQDQMGLLGFAERKQVMPHVISSEIPWVHFLAYLAFEFGEIVLGDQPIVAPSDSHLHVLKQAREMDEAHRP